MCRVGIDESEEIQVFKFKTRISPSIYCLTFEDITHKNENKTISRSFLSLLYSLYTSRVFSVPLAKMASS